MIARGNLGASLSNEVNQARADGASGQDILQYFRPGLIELAKIGRRHAANHRGVFTGGVGIFHVTDLSEDVDFYDIGVFHNWSPVKGDPKSCSEMGAGENARTLQETYGVNAVNCLELVVASPKSRKVIKSITGLALATLIPCHDCVDVLNGNPDVFHSEMPIITVGVGRYLGRDRVRDYTLASVNEILASVERPLSSGELLNGSAA